MRNINKKIDSIILKYQLDKYYPCFREKQSSEKRCFSSFLSWEDSYFDCMDNESVNTLKSYNLIERLDIIVLESIRCFCELNKNTEAEKKKEYLERLFFLAIYKRNFILAEEILCELQRNFEDIDEYQEAWKAINDLLECIRKTLKNRKYQDIAGIWIDAVSYVDIKEISYLEELRQVDYTISFSNAYTMTPYTNPTFALMMTGKKRIDDQSYLIKKIDDSNSEVIALLKNHGYLCKFLSSYWKQIDDSYRGEIDHYICAPCSEMLWDMICHLLDEKHPVFVMTHIFCEPHFPYLSMNQKTISDCVEDMRRLRGRQEVDRQLRYYMDFLGSSVTKLFFSDHGDHFTSADFFHTVLEIQGENFERENIEEIFSYAKFPDLFRQIILDKRIDKSTLISDYAEIQEVPLYNKNTIKNFIQEKTPLNSQHVWGYKGIIDRNYIYLYYGESKGIIRESLMENGCEDYFENMCIFGYYHICNEELVPYYREIVKRKPMAYIQDQKFKYSRYLQEMAENIIPKHIRKVKLLQELFSTLPVHGIAFRGGGLDTKRILRFYKVELQGVEYIIDQNKNCQCSSLNIPIISIEDMGKYSIHTVVLPSKKFEEEFRKESLDYPSNIQIIDIYQYLKNNCIVEEYPFYYFQPDDEDCNVGFLFDE